MSVVALDSRRPLTIGGSEAAAAAGIDPYRSRVMLWAEKTGRVERPESEAMTWGKLLQPVIAEELGRRGYEVMPAPADGFRDESYPFVVGHPDGFTALEGEPAVVEIKTAGPWSAGHWNGEAKAPTAYLAQVQQYLYLTGYEVALLAVLVGGQHLQTRIVRRDDRAIETLLEREADFAECVRTDQPPAPDGSESAAAALSSLFPAAGSGSVARLDATGWQVYRQLKARREQRDAIDRQVSELEQRLKLAMGEAETAISPHDEPVLRWSNVERRAVDVKALREQRPELAELFTKTTTTRRFTVE